MLKKIISGGQTGADRGGLEAGKELGLETGGTAPYNWMTALGSAKGLLEGYGLVAGPYDPKTWPKRTWRNVLDSDGTIVFGDFYSPGTKLTAKYCKTALKPLYRVCREDNPIIEKQDLLNWLEKHSIRILNVAGNREHKNPGIQERVKNFLVEVLRDSN